MTKRHFWSEWSCLVAGLVCLDTMGLVLALGLAYETRFVWEITPYKSPVDPSLYLGLDLAIVLVWLSLFWLHGLYSRRVLLGGFREYAAVVNACTYTTLVVAFATYIGRDMMPVSRGWLLLTWVCSILCIGSLRFGSRRVVFRLRRRGIFVRRAIIIGADDQGLSLADHLSPSRGSGIQVLGFLHDYLAPGTVLAGGLPIFGEPTVVAKVVEEQEADLVIVIPQAISWESLQVVMQAAVDTQASFECCMLPGPYDIAASGIDIDRRGPVPLLVINQMRIAGFEGVMKGALDYAGASMLLLASLPLIALLALLTARKGKSLIEGHEYLGVRGQPFQALGFRGWRDGKIEKSGNMLERFLFARRLYRLPGFLNVLRGEMSLVGPRRVTAVELEEQSKWRHTLLSVKPGLTGPWLIAGGECLPLRETLRLDLHYVRYYSIWLDLQILFRTLRLLLCGFGLPPKERGPDHLVSAAQQVRSRLEVKSE